MVLILVSGLTAGMTDAGMQPGVQAPEDAEFVNDGTERLNLLVGLWTVTQAHFDAEGNEIASVKGTEEISWILDRRAIERVYATGDKPNVFHARCTLSWNDSAKVYQGFWFDNVSTSGPTRVQGRWNEKDAAFLFSLEVSGKTGAPTKYRVTERIVDEQTRETTTHLVKADGTTVKLLESKYVRSYPCPARLRPVFDELLGPGGK